MSKFTENDYYQIKRVRNLCSSDYTRANIWEQVQNIGIEYLPEIVYYSGYNRIGFGIEKVTFHNSFERCASVIRVINNALVRDQIEPTEDISDFYIENANQVLAQPYGVAALAKILSIIPMNKMVRFAINGMVQYDINVSSSKQTIMPYYYEAKGNADKILKVVDFYGGCTSLIQMLPYFTAFFCENAFLEQVRNSGIKIDSSKAENKLEEAICLFCQIVFSQESDDISGVLEELKQIILSSQDTPSVYFALGLFFSGMGYDKQVIKIVTHMASYLSSEVSEDMNYKWLRHRFIQGVDGIQLPVSAEMVNYINERLQ